MVVSHFEVRMKKGRVLTAAFFVKYKSWIIKVPR
jgi:hypothetical protein